MLRKAGIARIVMVTGDRAAAAETIGAALDLDCVLADRVPWTKSMPSVPNSGSIRPCAFIPRRKTIIYDALTAA